MKAIIPIGGRGTRMRPITFSQNKHFIPVGNKMLIEYPIQTIVDAGIHEIAITYNPGQLKYAQDILGDGSKWAAEFTFILQAEPLGLANIYEVCEEWINEDTFVLHLGDNIFTDGIINLVRYFEANKPNGLVAMVHHPENTRLGVPYFDTNGRLTQYVEKPQNPPHDFAIPGIYFMDRNGFKCFHSNDRLQPSARGEFEIPDAYQWMINHNYRVDVMEYTGKWLDPGKFGDWLETNQYLLDQNTINNHLSEIDASVRIEGRVSIGKDCTITNSTVRGPVSIGDNVVIKDSFIGPYTSIYNQCKLNKCYLENSVLMGDVMIDNVVKPIDTSLIGPGSKINSNNSGNTINVFLGELSEISL